MKESREREREKGGGELKRTRKAWMNEEHGETRGEYSRERGRAVQMQIFAATEIETIRQLESST